MRSWPSGRSPTGSRLGRGVLSKPALKRPRRGQGLVGLQKEANQFRAPGGMLCAKCLRVLQDGLRGFLGLVLTTLRIIRRDPALPAVFKPPVETLHRSQRQSQLFGHVRRLSLVFPTLKKSLGEWEGEWVEPRGSPLQQVSLGKPLSILRRRDQQNRQMTNSVSQLTRQT